MSIPSWREFVTRAILRFKISEFRDLLIEAVYITEKSIEMARAL